MSFVHICERSGIVEGITLLRAFAFRGEGITRGILPNMSGSLLEQKQASLSVLVLTQVYFTMEKKKKAALIHDLIGVFH